MSNTNKDFDLLTLSQDVVTNTKSGADLSNLLLSYREKVATRFDDYLLEWESSISTLRRRKSNLVEIVSLT